jgi:hypothetical protein
MKRGTLILLLGLLVAAGAFCGFYYLGTASCRSILSQPEPELAWLKKEYHLSDAEFARISHLHAAYLPQCRERCQRIAQLNAKLQQLLATATNVTPEIKSLLAQRATIRAECESEMLQHFLQISRTMPPEEGQRYLAWVEGQTFMGGQSMENSPQMQEHHRMSEQPHP